MTGPRVLVVEDEGLVAKDIQLTLEELGYDVCGTVPTGEEAVRLAHELGPDVVLMDIRLKGEMDGIRAAELIDQDGGSPVIFLTAHSDRATLDRAALTDPFGYILKPFEAADLRVAIEVTLHKAASDRRLREHEHLLETILAGLEDAVIGVNEHGAVTFMNDAATRLTGLRAEATLGTSVRHVLRVHSPQTGENLVTLMEEVLRSGGPRRAWQKAVLLTRNNHETPVDGNVALLMDAKGNHRGAVVTLRDRSLAARVNELTAERDRLLAALRKRVDDLI